MQLPRELSIHHRNAINQPKTSYPPKDSDAIPIHMPLSIIEIRIDRLPSLTFGSTTFCRTTFHSALPRGFAGVSAEASPCFSGMPTLSPFPPPSPSFSSSLDLLQVDQATSGSCTWHSLRLVLVLRCYTSLLPDLLQ
jgi:hypothetical protein